MQWDVDKLEESTNPPDLFAAALAAVGSVSHLVSRVVGPSK
jgi:hypothetical protein